MLSIPTDQDQPMAAISANQPIPRKEEFPSSYHMKWIVAFLMVYFGLRLLYFAINISPSVPPDEATHFGVSRIFSNALFLPVNSPETYQYGLVTNIPWLYYWIMGKLLGLNFFGITDLLFLRLLNLPFAFGTVIFVWRILRLLTDNRLTQILLVAAMTNTVMFTFLSASVSYDNLTNLLSAMAIYYLLAFFKCRTGNLLAAFVLCQLLGCLSKISFLPLSLVLWILFFVHEIKNIRLLPTALKDYLRFSGKRGIALSLAITICMIFNIQLYGGNYIKYGKLAPEVADVFPIEVAMKNHLAARNMIYTLYKNRQISYAKASEMVSHISHPATRTDTMFLIQDYARRVYYGEKLLSPWEYLVPWGQRILESVFGIMGHRNMTNQGFTLMPFVVLLALTAVSIVIRWRPRDFASLPTYLMIIAGFYAFFLMYFVNYATYKQFESFQLALQGRYIFPVIGPLYVLMSYYLMRLIKGRYAEQAVAVAVTIIFIVSDLPYFLIHATPEWFSITLR